jgi:hypothetical protein
MGVRAFAHAYATAGTLTTGQHATDGIRSTIMPTTTQPTPRRTVPDTATALDLIALAFLVHAADKADGFHDVATPDRAWRSAARTAIAIARDPHARAAWRASLATRHQVSTAHAALFAALSAWESADV